MSLWTFFLTHEETAAHPIPSSVRLWVVPAFTGKSSASTQAGTVCVGSEPFYLVCISCPRCDDSASFVELVMGAHPRPHPLPELRADGKSTLRDKIWSPRGQVHSWKGRWPLWLGPPLGREVHMPSSEWMRQGLLPLRVLTCLPTGHHPDAHL